MGARYYGNFVWKSGATWSYHPRRNLCVFHVSGSESGARQAPGAAPTAAGFKEGGGRDAGRGGRDAGRGGRGYVITAD